MVPLCRVQASCLLCCPVLQCTWLFPRAQECYDRTSRCGLQMQVHSPLPLLQLQGHMSYWTLRTCFSSKTWCTPQKMVMSSKWGGLWKGLMQAHGQPAKRQPDSRRYPWEQGPPGVERMGVDKAHPKWQRQQMSERLGVFVFLSGIYPAVVGPEEAVQPRL